MSLTINDGSNGKVVEDFSAVLPGIRVTVLSVDLVIESINSCDLSGLVIATEQSDPFWVLHLETEEVFEGLH